MSWFHKITNINTTIEDIEQEMSCLTKRICKLGEKKRYLEQKREHLLKEEGVCDMKTKTDRIIEQNLFAIAHYVFSHKGKCVNCGALLEEGSLKSIDHEFGIEVEGKENPQWIYFHCKKCGYDSALWKVLKQIRAEEELNRK